MTTTLCNNQLDKTKQQTKKIKVLTVSVKKTLIIFSISITVSYYSITERNLNSSDLTYIYIYELLEISFLRSCKSLNGGDLAQSLLHTRFNLPCEFFLRNNLGFFLSIKFCIYGSNRGRIRKMGSLFPAQYFSLCNRLVRVVPNKDLILRP